MWHFLMRSLRRFQQWHLKTLLSVSRLANYEVQREPPLEPEDETLTECASVMFMSL